MKLLLNILLNIFILQIYPLTKCILCLICRFAIVNIIHHSKEHKFLFETKFIEIIWIGSSLFDLIVSFYALISFQFGIFYSQEDLFSMDIGA